MADLPPTEYLILEVLAARVRLGERMWTFPAKVKPALDSLQARGLIWTRSAPTPKDYQAYLTDAGKLEAFGEDYSPPGALARALLEEALHLRMNGERAPGGSETWREWDTKAEAFLRSLPDR